VAPNLCSEVFEFGDDNGKTRIVEKYSKETTEELSAGDVPDSLRACVTEAAEACPVQAITIE
jgi:ferredoxin